MKSQALQQDRNSAETGPAGTSAAVATRRWPESLLASVGHHDEEPQGFDELRAVSRRSLWSLQLFLLISVAAFFVRDFDLYATLPESVLQVLGCSPPPILIHLALAGYIFTVLTPLLIHMVSNDKPVSNWRHLGYRAAFYCFYLVSNTLTANFTLVFAACIVLYLLEQANVCISMSRFNHGDGQLV
jgi:hypothetical protein